MSNPAYELLGALLDRAERGAGQVRPLSITPRSAPAYFDKPDLASRDQIHAALRNAEAAGAVRLEWGRYEASADLVRIRLLDADRLATFLGRERSAASATHVKLLLAPILAEAPEWVRRHADRALERWRRGQKADGMSADQHQEIACLYQALSAVARNEHRGTDLRTFSARVLGDSKAMERMQRRFARIWCQAHDLDLEPGELFAELGLEKFPQPVFVKGPVVLRLGGSALDVAPISPFLAFSPDHLDGVAAPGGSYVLTVENLASFQRHVREVRDAGIVLFSGGYPSPAFRAFLALLDRTLPRAVPFYHWGDLDLGGLRILGRLAQTVRRPLRPHLMSPEYLRHRAAPIRPADRAALARLEASGGPVADLAAVCLRVDVCFEQELLDPRPPG